MDEIIFSLSSWPRAIVHIDGDAFFTSCEEVIHPELKGKPIIAGARSRNGINRTPGKISTWKFSMLADHSI